MKMTIKTIATLLFAMISLSSQAGDELNKATLGKSLHDEKCLACHTTSTYTREDHTMKSLDALTVRVTQCMNPAKAEWNDKEKDAVVEYISKNFYKF